MRTAIVARSVLASLVLLRACVEPAAACPAVDGPIQVVDVAKGCPAPFDGVLHTHDDDDARKRAADKAADALDASSKKIRDLEAAAKAVENPPSRLRWYVYGAASALMIVGAVALIRHEAK